MNPESRGGRVLAVRADRSVVAYEAKEIVVKAFVKRTGLAGLRDRLFGDRAARAFRAGKRAEKRGIRVASPLETRNHALVLRYIAGAKSAKEVARTKDNVVALARFLRAIHDARLYPSDFHAGNVLFDQQMQPTLIDYENLRAVWWISKRRRIRNLERLLRDFLGEQRVSRSTRMRFLRAYAKTKEEARDLWRRIDARSREKREAYALPAP